MNNNIRNIKEKSLSYHFDREPGKIEVVPRKECKNQDDLSMAYTPGVAYPCLEIEKDRDNSYRYTSKGNLVAVISNGTAVLGLGDIGADASKPVMEGKGILFKRFADVDVFDLELNLKDPDKIIEVVKSLEPTFGGVNLEDIKAPECFYIEEKLKEIMNIPVFHDDQHGTAIISGAAFLNALEIAKKNIEDVKIVFNGAGAAGIACAKFYLSLGIKKENLILCDTKGVIYAGRNVGMNKYKEYFAIETEKRNLQDALVGADAFVGVSVKDVLAPDMIKSMNKDPIVFAMANPDPEIEYDVAKSCRDDVIMASGRSDYPNQVNNVLGFPFIFRGALDVRARCINEEMKLAAARALADLVKREAPEEVKKAYNLAEIEFGRDYIIPKPFDTRAFIEVSQAVAWAAVESGVAQIIPKSREEYRKQLTDRYENKIKRFS